MGFFKKLARGVRKTVGKKLLTKALRIGAGIVTGGQSEVALRGVSKVRSLAKSLGVRTGRRGRLSKSESVTVAKLAGMAPPQLKTTPSAETMPGGAPLSRSVQSQWDAGFNPVYGGKAPRSYTGLRQRAAKTARKAPSGRRKPPKGGKDLKALSASWKAAGKPGRWIDWVKSH